MATPRYFVEGQWNVTCDYCGRNVKAGNTQKTWNGYRVCDWHKAEENPLERKGNLPERQSLPWKRTRPPEVWVDLKTHWLLAVQGQGSVNSLGARTQVPSSSVTALATVQSTYAKFLLPLSGKVGTGVLGSLRPVISGITLTEVAGIGGVRSLQVILAHGIMQTSATVALGTVSPVSSRALTQVFGTGVLGTLGLSVTVGPVTQKLATTSIKSLSVNFGPTLTQVLGTGSTGALSRAMAVPLTQVTGTGVRGAFGPVATLGPLTQVSGSGSITSVQVVFGPALTQVAGSGRLGVLKPSLTTALTQVAGAGALGTLRPVIGQVAVGVSALASTNVDNSTPLQDTSVVNILDTSGNPITTVSTFMLLDDTMSIIQDTSGNTLYAIPQWLSDAGVSLTVPGLTAVQTTGSLGVLRIGGQPVPLTGVIGTGSVQNI